MRHDFETVMAPNNNRIELHCPAQGCDMADRTHVVAVHWEKDPEEGDRKRARMEVRCENGHGFVLAIKNNAGWSYFEWEALTDNVSPFGLDW